LVSYSRVDFTSFGKIRNLEQPTGIIDFGGLGCRWPLSNYTVRQ
jgi:hypothetical protein